MAFLEDSAGIEATIADAEAAPRLVTRLRDALVHSAAAEGLR